MLHFLAFRDSDTDRRARFLDAVKAHRPQDPAHRLDEHRIGDTTVLSLQAPEAAYGRHTTPDAHALLCGFAFDPADERPLDAQGLMRHWAAWDGRHPPPATLDGYHVGIVASITGRLVLGADPTGMFPIYWWQGDGVFVAASTPEWIWLHPAFRRAPSPMGLAGILLTQHLVGGRSLIEGVRRLDAGNLLYSEAAAPAREVAQYRIPLNEDGYDLPFSVQVEAMGEVTARAVRRHTPPGGRDTFALLSGGLDSRMVVGYLAEMGIRPPALTFGHPGDIELRCAAGVARHLGLPQTVYDVNLEQHVALTRHHARWTHLSGGFNSIEYWQSAPAMRRLGRYCATGSVMEITLGGAHIPWGMDPKTRRFSFDGIFRFLNRFACPPEWLKTAIVDRALLEAVDEVQAELRRTYEAYAPREFQRVWLFDIMHRQRFHTGSFFYVLSFGACTLMPAIDIEVMRYVAGLPAGTLAERRAQVELAKLRFPELSELPLDRNSHNDMPLSPRLRTLVERRLRAKAVRVLPFLRPDRGAERRYYFRLYDFNSPGWKAVRAEAEAGLKQLDGLFDVRKIREFLPPPDQDLDVKDGIIDYSGRKLLLGLALWAREHL